MKGIFRDFHDPIDLVIGSAGKEKPQPYQIRNHDHIELLQKQIEDTETVVPFVGAGVAIPFGYPGWSQFLLNCCGGREELRKLIEERIRRVEYEVAAEELEKALGRKQFNGLIRDVFKAKVSGHSKPTGSTFLWHLAAITKYLVITTNFDRLLECAFKAFSEHLDQVIIGPRLGEVDEGLFGRSRLLIKLHGDCVDPENRILTKSEYDRGYGAPDEIDYEKPVPKMLRRAIEGKALLFIGCSLSFDRTLDLLSKLTKSYEFARHFAIVAGPNAPKELEDFRTRLYECGINPIVYPAGRHECVQRIMEYVVPSGEAPLTLRRGYLATGLANLAFGVTFMLFNRIEELPHYGAVVLGIPVLSLSSVPVLWCALKHAYSAPSRRWSDRILPILRRSSASNIIWNRLFPLFAFIVFPIYTACHLVLRMGAIGGIFRRGADKSSYDGASLYDWRNFDWGSLKGHEWVWHHGHGLTAYPALQPQIYRGAAVLCAIAGIWLLIIVVFGIGANRVRKLKE